MILTKVTFTGVDERTDVKRLVKLQKKFPFAEFGILLSYDWQANGCRFPDPLFLNELPRHKLNLSAHLCGGAASDVAHGKRTKLERLLSSNSIRLFSRCQLNIDAGSCFSDLRRLKPIPFIDEVIIQMHTTELLESFLHGQIPRHTSYLLDSSCGAGIDTPFHVFRAPGIHIGYAGGIGPENVEDKLRTLLEFPSSEKFWIDMETRVRTITVDGEWFDLDKVEEVLKICSSIINELKKDRLWQG